MASRLVTLRAVRSSLDARVLVPGLPCRVVAVHRRAINLLVGDELVTLTVASAGGLPGSVLVEEPFDPRGLGITTRDRATLAPARVEIGSLTVDLYAAEPWRPRLAPRAAPADLPERVVVARAALGFAGSDGFASLPGAAGQLRAFRATVQRGRAGDIASAGDAVIGLGAGLTPAGDDVLVGFTASLAAVGDPVGRRLAARWAGMAATRTTDVAAAYLRHAARGDYAERLHDLATALLDGPLAAVPAAVRAASHHGATSGIDTATGFVIGLEATANGGLVRAA